MMDLKEFQEYPVGMIFLFNNGNINLIEVKISKNCTLVINDINPYSDVVEEKYNYKTGLSFWVDIIEVAPKWI